MIVFTFFQDHPERMLLIAAAFLICYAAGFAFFRVKGKKLRRLWPALVLGCIWLACGLWEQHCVNMEYNIRVDLMFLLPFTYGLTLGLIICQIILLIPEKTQGSIHEHEEN